MKELKRRRRFTCTLMFGSVELDAQEEQARSPMMFACLVTPEMCRSRVCWGGRSTPRTVR